MRWIFFTFLFSAGFSVNAQEQRCRFVDRFNRDFVLDTLTIVPSSIEVKGDGGIKVSHNVNTGNIFLETAHPPDSVEVCYQVLPFALHKTYARRDVAEIGTEEEYKAAENAPQKADIGIYREELFYTEDLYKSGSLSRSISFGNAQDVVVNSQLNLQLEGKLTEDINIRASITDQDVPYQPEGNTAQIQDFDNVFIQLYNKKFDLIAGDVVLKDKGSHFLKYYKNVQGGLLGLNYKVGVNGIANTSFGASVAKGKFASILIDVQEGVAGPYRIVIPDASRLAIILANSERVFLDGRQLSRGFDYDYVIDYDKAEITFTTRVLITQYSRVRIDVEYADQNYGRGVVAFNHYQSHKDLDLFINYYSEKDNRNNPLKYNLSNQDKLLLSQVGDDVDNAFKEGFEEAEYNPQKVQYILKDTLTLDMQTTEVFEYSAASNEQLYDVVFTEVNPGEGDYVRKNDLVNGVIFQWASPEGGQKSGNYIPARKIDPPTKKNMANAGINYRVTDYERVFTEVAFSSYDRNLYSEMDSHDDNDYAYFTGIESKGREVMQDVKMTTGFSFEKNGRYFTPIDRFRYIEFDRDWNYNSATSGDVSEENILKANVGFEKDPDNTFSYEVTKRKRGEAIDGTQHVMELNKKAGRVYSRSNAFLMQNESSDFNSSWNRLNSDLHYRSKIFVPGYQFSIDRNVLRHPESDSVLSTEMNFYEHLFYLRSNDTLKTRFRLDYAYREDQLPDGGIMELSNVAHTSNFMVNHDSKNNRIEALVTYRKSKSFLVESDRHEETINSRLDWYGNFFQDHVRSGLSYTIGSGRELRRDFIFIEVLTGQGTHTWRDDNGNGIKELNEFYLAVNPEEKNYAKIFVPTNEFVFAHVNNFNYRLNADMPATWASDGGLKLLLSKFSNVTSFTSLRKITDQSIAARFLPFGSKINEEDLISSRFSFNSRMFFNRRDPRYGIDLGFSQFDNKQFLTGGFEKRTTDTWNLNFRSNIRKEFSVNLKAIDGEITNSSDFLAGRNYAIQNRELSPQLSWQPNVQFRITGEYSYRNKMVLNDEEDDYSNIHEGALSAIYNKATNISVNTVFKLSRIDFQGEENSPAGYELLEALRPGDNYIWNIALQKKLISGLQLSVNYEGRKSADYKTIHIGRMQVSVLF